MRANVSVNHTIAMHKLQSKNYACDDKFCLFLVELFLLVMEVVAKIAARTVLSDKVEIIKLLKAITNVAQSWMN